MSEPCDCEPVLSCEIDAIVECIVSERLRAIAERLRVPQSGLVPDAEVYVRETLARAIEEGLEER